MSKQQLPGGPTEAKHARPKRWLFGPVQRVSLPNHQYQLYLPELPCTSADLNALPFKSQQCQCALSCASRSSRRQSERN